MSEGDTRRVCEAIAILTEVGDIITARDICDLVDDVSVRRTRSILSNLAGLGGGHTNPPLQVVSHGVYKVLRHHDAGQKTPRSVDLSQAREHCPVHGLELPLTSVCDECEAYN